MNDIRGLRIALVGPLPPPAGGMANQTVQLRRLLESEGALVEMVQVNAPYRPAWAGRIPGARALFRMLPYARRLRAVSKRVDLLHVMANSGWAWHLFAAPAIRAGAKAGVAVVVNYRGGEAEAFFRRSFKHVERTLRLAACTVVPSGFLQEIFRKFGADTEIVANIVDLARFSPNPLREFGDAPRIVVTRNLEALYDIGTALRSFARVRESFRAAQLSIAGSGPQRLALEQLAADLGLLSAVEFTGLLKPEQMASLYARADVMLNPSLADNMPNSVLEALASGVPVVSTNVGGVPFLVQDGRSALLVPAADPERMAQATLRILRDRALAAALRANGLELVGAFTWGQVKANWFAVYERALQRNSPDQDLAPSR